MIYLISDNYRRNQSNDIELKKNIQLASLSDLKDFVKPLESIQIDTETVGDIYDPKGFIFTTQIGNYHNQFVIDCTDPKNVEVIKEILLTNKQKLLQNAAYDIQWFLRWGINPTNIYDTMLVEMVLNTGLEGVGYSLDVLSKRYCEESEISKDIRGKITYLGLTPEVVDYAAGDVKYLHKIQQGQKAKIEAFQLQEVVDLENNAVRVFAEMSYNGIKLDEQKWLEIEKEHKKEKEKRQKDIFKYIKQHPVKDHLNISYDLFEGLKVNINLDSPKQLLSLFNKIGEIENNKYLKNLDGTDQKKNINPIINKHDIIPLFLKYKDEVTNINKYGANFLIQEDIKGKRTWSTINPNDGRVHPSFWQIKNTGRVSCNKPNLQQIPSKTRHRNAFIPEEGNVFIAADFSSQELILIAEDSKEPVWIEATKQGWDLHSSVAELVFGKEWKNAALDNCLYYAKKQKCDCPKHKKLRDSIKTVNYGLTYGAGADKLALILNISPYKAKKIIDKYFSVMGKLRTRFSQLKQYGRDYHMIRTFEPFRRIRFFEPPQAEWQKAEIERQSMNTRFQGTGADMCKLALVNVHKKLYPKYTRNQVKIILQVHDEIILECKRELVNEIKPILIKAMTDAADYILKELKIGVDAEVLEYWKK